MFNVLYILSILDWLFGLNDQDRGKAEVVAPSIQPLVQIMCRFFMCVMYLTFLVKLLRFLSGLIYPKLFYSLVLQINK